MTGAQACVEPTCKLAEDHRSVASTLPARLCRRVWGRVSFLLRLLCFCLLGVMFSFKVRDFLSRPVVSTTNLAHCPLPYLTICPAVLNVSAIGLLAEDWETGNVTTEQVLRASEVALPDLLLSYVWSGCPSNSTLCGRWTRRRVPGGLTCYTLHQPAAAHDAAGSYEIKFSLALPGPYSIGDGGSLYTIFAHGEPTPKAFYGGRLLSAYHVLQAGTFTELVLSWTEWRHVSHPQRPCSARLEYDPNKCLLDCYAAAAFAVANCSADWGAPTGRVPHCRTRAQYTALERAWTSWRGREHCRCPEPCTYHSVGISAHRAQTFTLIRSVELQVRFNFRQLLVEERVSYGVVDLLVDLGGTLGLLLGYSLVSLVELGDQLVGLLERREQETGGRKRRCWR